MALENLPKVTEKQLALDLFDKLVERGMTISESPQDIGFQRNNAIINVSNLGTSAYRALDAFAFVVMQEQNIQARYDVDLSYFRWLMRYDSANYRHFRAILRELQQAAIQVSEEDDSSVTLAPADERWASVPLLGHAELDNGRLIFEMAPVLQRHLKDPAKAHWLSLRASTALTLLYGRVIYNHVLPYVLEGITPWFPVEEIQGWPGTGTPIAQYKYFKRDSLEPAVKQINELTNINIAYDTRGEFGSKRIAFLRFRVSFKEGIKPFGAADELHDVDALYKTLRDEFGLSPVNFNEIHVHRDSWTNLRIEQAIEFTRWNLQRGKVNKSPAGYLMYALRNNLRVSSAEKVMEEENQKLAASRAAKESKAGQSEREHLARKASSEKAAQSSVEQAAEAGWLIYENLDLVGREACIKEFARSAQAKIMARQDKLKLADLTEEMLMTHKLTGQAFAVFLAQSMPR